jgi:uncharacterized protein YkwD
MTLRISTASAICVLLLTTPAPGQAPPAPRFTGLAVQTWFKQHHLPTVTPNRILHQVAHKNSSALAEVDTQVPEGSRTYLQFLLVQHNVRDAVIKAKAFHYRSLSGLKRGLWSFLEEHAIGGGFTHYGIGFSRAAGTSNRVMTLILVRRRVTLTSIQAVVGSRLELCARIRSGINPRVLITTPRGRVIQRNPLLSRAQRRFCANMPHIVHPGRYQVEVMVEGPFGLEVAALFPLYAGMAAPSHPVQKIYPPASKRRRHVEQHLFNLLNRARSSAGLKPLRPSGGLGRVARSHSRDMARRGFFGHRSPRLGDLDRRLSRAGLQHFAQASENLVLSTGARKAHDSLMNSPSHRRNMLDPDLTQVGIGAALDQSQGLFYITQCYAR